MGPGTRYICTCYALRDSWGWGLESGLCEKRVRSELAQTFLAIQ